MTQVLRRDPLMLYNILSARKADLERGLALAKTHLGVGDRVEEITEALAAVDAALAKNIAKLNEIAAAEEAEEVDDVDEDPSSEEGEAFEEPEVPPEEGAFEGFDEPAEEDGGAVIDEGATAEMDLDVAAAEFAVDEPQVVEEELEPANPVAMNQRLRKEMGELAADVLDDYALKIHAKIKGIFETMLQKSLNLGDTNQVTSLREQLMTEIGTRGLERMEPYFSEWRAGVIKSLTQDVKDLFEPPEPDPEEPVADGLELDLPLSPEEEVPSLVEEPEAPIEAPLEEEEAPVDLPPEEEPAVEPVAAAASPVAGRVSFMVRDFRPQGRRQVNLD
jgi:hypothetical protein